MAVQEEPRKAVFVHIEKTAGTSVRYAVESAVGPEHVFIYSPETDRLVRSSDNLMPATTPFLDRLRQAFGNPVFGPILVNFWPMVSGLYRERIRRKYPRLEIPEDAKVLFGHFAADRFDHLLPEEPIRAAVLREPFERMRSHYDHWRRSKGYEDWRVRVPFNPQMTFQQFAMLPEMQNYQAQALAGKDLNAFNIVGTSENIEEFTETLLRKLAQAGLTLPGQERDFEQRRLNITPEGRRTRAEILDANFLQRFREFHTLDYALYHQARLIQENRIQTSNN